MILINKTLATEAKVAKKAKEARVATDAKEMETTTKAEGDSVRETIALVMAKINATVEVVSVGPVPDLFSFFFFFVSRNWVWPNFVKTWFP